jgi:epoxyqueuosine reductase
VCPWNVSFSTALREPAFAARPGLDSPDARALSRELLVMSADRFTARFKNSAIKRAKRRGLARNAAVVLGNVGTPEDVPLLEEALEHTEPIVHEHATCARERLQARFR